MTPITYQSLPEEALNRPSWKVDPQRAQRALHILTDHKPGTMLMLASRDENDMPVSSDQNLWIVRGSARGWYFVRPDDHSCTCPDHRKGHVCKHRLAVYLYTQQIERTRAAVIADIRSKRTEEQILQDLGF